MIDSRYDILLAHTLNSRSIVYNIRNKVYCIEKGWESKSNNLDGMELDEYDIHSVHFLVFDRKSCDYVGTMRLIVGRYEYLPICQFVNPFLNRHYHTIVSEISRLIILSKENRKSILLYLVCAARDYANLNNIQYGYFMTDLSLYKRLKQIGIKVYSLGDIVEHHGNRLCCFVLFKTIFDPIKDKDYNQYLALTRVHELSYKIV